MAGLGSATGSKRENYSENLWSKRPKKEEANTIFVQSLNAWGAVENVSVGETKYHYAELEATFKLLQLHRLLKVTYEDREMRLPCNACDDNTCSKVKLLCDYAAHLPFLEVGKGFPMVKQRERPGQAVNNPDSDDEGVPDEAVVPPFPAEKLNLVHDKFKRLCHSYLAAMGIGFTIALGKSLWRHWGCM